MSSTYANAQILLGLPSGIVRRQTEGVIITDILGGFARPGGWGDSPAGFLPENSDNGDTPGTAWVGNPYTVNVVGCNFIRFLKGGTYRLGASVSEGEQVDMAGYFLQPREAALSSKIGPNQNHFEEDATDLHWEAVKGRWVTVPALRPYGGTAMHNRGADEIAVARTMGSIPANRAHRLDLHLQGAIRRDGKTPLFRHFFGNAYCVQLIAGQKPQICRVTYDQNGNGGTLQILKTLNEAAPVNVSGGRYRIDIWRVNGRLCVAVDGVAVWLYDVVEKAASSGGTSSGDSSSGGTSSGDAPADAGKQVKDFAWLAAKWQVEAQNLRVARLEYSVLKYATASGEPLTGTVSRAVSVAAFLNPANGAQTSCGGWKRGGVRASVEAFVSNNTIEYVLTLKGGPDGIDTPFIDKVMCQYMPTYTTPTSTAIDVRGCCDHLSLSFVAPPDAAGAQGTILLDRNRLDRQFGTSWGAHTQMWNPVTINVQRAGDAYSRLFDGYLFKPSLTSGVGRERKLSLVVRDPLLRLQKIGDANHAAIDERYPPLDMLFAIKSRGSNGGYDGEGNAVGATLTIAECVQALLRIALGDPTADSLNGNGNPLRFIPANHPPLMTNANDRCGWAQIEALGAATGGESAPVTSGGWMAPPPYGSAVYDWIMELATKDKCVFYYGWPDGATTARAPVPIYGRLQNILGVAPIPLHILKDKTTTTPGGVTDWPRLLKSMESERRPERDVNVVDVWGPQAQGMEGIAPSLSMGRSRLPVNDPRAAEKTWERKLILRENLALLGAQSIADGVAGLLTGVDMQWPTFNFEGDERVGLGHIVSPSLTGSDADTGSGLNGEWFRAEAVSHDIDFLSSPGTMTTSVRPRPLTSAERRAFQQNGETGGAGESGTGGSDDTSIPVLVE